MRDDNQIPLPTVVQTWFAARGWSPHAHTLGLVTGAEPPMRALVDFDRIEEMIARIRGRIDFVRLSRLSPLMLEAGREKVAGSAEERLIDETFAAEAMLDALS